MAKPKYLTVHSTIAGAIAKIGEVVIDESWKQTANQTRKERAIVIPMECVKAIDAPEFCRALVEACLLSSAKATLKQFVNDQPNNYQIPAELFERPQLIESFLTRAESWMEKKDLELALSASATWKKFVGRSEFASDVAYQAAVNDYKESVVKLAAKGTHLNAETRDWILAKMEPEDLNTDLGAFIQRRFESMQKTESKNSHINRNIL